MVTWSDDTSGSEEIYIKRFDGSDWVEVGMGSASGGGIVISDAVQSNNPSLVLDVAGNPVVTWCSGPWGCPPPGDRDKSWVLIIPFSLQGW